MSNIYCGMGQVPSGKTRGTDKQCLKKNQVRYWGIKQIDDALLNKNNLDADKEFLKLKKLEVGLKGMAKRFEREKSAWKKKKEKKKTAALNKEIEKDKKKLEKLMKKIKKAQEMYDIQKKVVSGLS